MPDPFVLSLIVATFLLAGFVKGVIGLGLPTISLAVLTAVIGLPQAMALMLFPSFLTNLWQALSGGQAIALIKRLWRFLLTATAFIFAGAAALTRVDVAILSALLGTLLIVYALIGLSKLRLVIAPGHEKRMGWLAGSLNGVLTGMTGSFVVPGVMYLQAIGLPRDQLIQAMGLLFTLSTIGLGVALGGNDMLSMELGASSALAILPAWLGMVLGQRVRQRLPEGPFRRVFFLSLMVLGIYIVGKHLA